MHPKALALASLLAVAILGAAPCASAAPPPDDDVMLAGTPAFHVFTDRDGLPQNTVHAIAFDRRGCIWIGTASGLASDCGHAWAKLPLPDGVHSDVVHAVAFDDDGTLWVGTARDGLLALGPQGWSRVDKAKGLPVDAVSQVWTTREQGRIVVWAGTPAGLARIQDGTARAVATPEGAFRVTRAIAETRDAAGAATLWVGTSGGLLRRDAAGAFRVVDDPSMSGVGVRALFATHDEAGAPELWVGTIGHGVRRFANGTWTTFDTKTGALPNDFILTVGETRSIAGERVVWVGTDGGGLARYTRGAWRTFQTTNSALPANFVAALASGAGEEASTLWIATLGGGIARVRDGGFVAFTAHDGSLPEGAVFPIEETVDAAGASSFWIGTEYGLARRRAGAWTRLTTKLPDANVVSLAAENEGGVTKALWVGTASGDIVRVEDDTWSVLPRMGSEPDSIGTLIPVRGAAGDRVLYASTATHGVGRFEAGRWTFWPMDPSGTHGIPGARTTCLRRTMAPGGAEVTWIGTNRGVVRAESGRYTTFDARATGSDADNVVAIGDVVPWRGKRMLWAATAGGGLVAFDADAPDLPWLRFGARTHPALPSDLVWSVEGDAEGRIYAFTSNGIARLTPRRDTPEFDVVTFSTEDGLPNDECGESASLVDRRGRIWIGTSTGAAVLDPSREATLHAAPLILERAQAGARAITDGIVLRHDEANVTFAFALAHYHRESETRYRVQLDGLDREPSAWTDSGVATYTNLAAADYALRVWGKDDRGNVTGPLVVRFRVLAPVWRRPWFYALEALAGALLVYGAVRLRVRALRAQTRLLEARVLERTRELDAKNRELEAKDAELRDDLVKAERFQRSLLPELPIDPRVTFDAVYAPAALVGGDFYDVITLAPGHFRVLVADVTGHGVQASLRTMVLSTEWEKWKRATRGLGAALTRLNAGLTRRHANLELQCSACCLDIVVDEAGGATMVYASAANPPILVATGGVVTEHRLPSAYLAMMEDAEFGEARVSLPNGARVLVHTDGLTERTSPSGEPFGDDRVRARLVEEGPLGEIVGTLVGDVALFGPPDDDVTVVAIAIVG